MRGCVTYGFGVLVPLERAHFGGEVLSVGWVRIQVRLGRRLGAEESLMGGPPEEKL